MGLMCPICRENLEKDPEGMPTRNGDEIDIQTTTCGHLFHSSCLDQAKKNTSNTCPMCRKKLKIIRLYPVKTEPDGDETIGGLEGKVLDLTEEVKLLRGEATLLAANYAELRVTHDDFMQEYAIMKGREMEAITKAQALQIKVEALQQYKKLSSKLESQLRELKSNLELYSTIKEQVKRQEVDVDVQYEALPKNGNTVKRLLHSENIIKARAKKLENERNEALKSSQNYYQEKMALSQEKSNLEAQLNEISKLYWEMIEKGGGRGRTQTPPYNKNILFQLKTPDFSESSPLFGPITMNGNKLKRTKSKDVPVTKTSSTTNGGVKKIKIKDENIKATGSSSQSQGSSTGQAVDDDEAFFKIKKTMPLLNSNHKLRWNTK